MKFSYLFIGLISAISFSACNNETKATTETNSEQVTTTEKNKDTTKKVEVNANDEGVNVSLKGSTSIDIGSSGGAVQTKTGTSIQVNEKGVKVNAKDVKVKVGKQ